MCYRPSMGSHGSSGLLRGAQGRFVPVANSKAARGSRCCRSGRESPLMPNTSETQSGMRGSNQTPRPAVSLGRAGFRPLSLFVLTRSEQL